MEKESWLQQSISTKREISSVAFSHDLYRLYYLENILYPLELMTTYRSGTLLTPRETLPLMGIPKKYQMLLSRLMPILLQVLPMITLFVYGFLEAVLRPKFLRDILPPSDQFNFSEMGGHF